MLSNVNKIHVATLPYETTVLAQDIAGGIGETGCMPSSKDFFSNKYGRLIQKYMTARSSAESRAHGRRGWWSGRRSVRESPFACTAAGHPMAPSSSFGPAPIWKEKWRSRGGWLYQRADSRAKQVANFCSVSTEIVVSLSDCACRGDRLVIAPHTTRPNFSPEV